MNDVSLLIGETQISGWTSIRITRGIERCPSDFDISLTERFDSSASALVVQPGDACKVMIGKDVVITGFVDRFKPSITKTTHTIQITGRGKCQDLVDCAAEWPGGQILGSSVLQIAQKLLEVYPGLSVSATGDIGAGIPQFNLMLGETPYDVIERICRYRALLAYEGTDGNLVLAAVGTTEAANGFTQGFNVENATATYSMDQRYSEYIAYLQSVDVFTDVGNGGNLLATVPDPTVTRHRRRVIIAEAGGGGQDVAKQRANWECSRRYGRSSMINLRTDQWRDKNGLLYTPNTLASLSLPLLKTDKVKWIIGDVTYTLDESGTHCDLVLMPPAAFQPQPILLQPFAPDVPAQAVQ